MKTTSSSSWDNSPTSFLTQNTCYVFFPNHMEKISISLGDGGLISLEGPGMHVNGGTMSWTGAGISHLSSRDVHGCHYE